MIKKALFEDEIIKQMRSNLDQKTSANIDEAINNLTIVSNVYTEYKLHKIAGQIDLIIEKLAKQRKPKNPTKINDWHTKGLTPAKQIKNLLDHGTQFNMSDDFQMLSDNDIDQLLNDDLEHKSNITDEELEKLDFSHLDFEDEID